MQAKRGQIVVELAILLPLAFFILFILAELCFLFNARQLLFLGSFQAARSYLVMKDNAIAEQCLVSGVSPVVFRDTVKKVTCLTIRESNGKIIAESVLLYRPLFPVLPLARFMNTTFLPKQHSAAVDRAVLKRTGDDWPSLIKSRLAIAATVELVK